MSSLIYRTSPYLATATAIALSLPPIGSAEVEHLPSPAKYRPLEQIGDLVRDALQPTVYVQGKSLALFSMLSEVALRLVRDSKPLDSDFSQMVDKEFWNLLK